MKDILVRVWDTKKKAMSMGMLMPQLAGYLTAIYPKLGNEVYMLFTGAYDKNKTPIFQGDILVFTTAKKQTHYHEVYWDEVKLQWKIRMIGGKSFDLTSSLYDKLATHAVVGHIHNWKGKK